MTDLLSARREQKRVAAARERAMTALAAERGVVANAMADMMRAESITAATPRPPPSASASRAPPPTPPSSAFASAALRGRRLSTSPSPVASCSIAPAAETDLSIDELRRRLDAKAREATRLREDARVASELEDEVRSLNAALDAARRDAADDAEAWDETRDAMARDFEETLSATRAELDALRGRHAKTSIALEEANAVIALMRSRAEDASVAVEEEKLATDKMRELLRHSRERAERAEARIVDVVDGEMAALEADNAGLRIRARRADDVVEAQVARAVAVAAEEASARAEAMFEARLASSAETTRRERDARTRAEAKLARLEEEVAASEGAGDPRSDARREHLAAIETAVAAAVAAERARGEETLRAAAAATAAAAANGDFGREAETERATRERAMRILRDELHATRKELVNARSAAVRAAETNVGAVIVADAIKASDALARDFVAAEEDAAADVRELVAATRAFLDPEDADADDADEECRGDAARRAMRRAAAVLRRAMATVDVPVPSSSAVGRRAPARGGSRKKPTRSGDGAGAGRPPGPRAVATTPGGLDALLLDAEEEEEEDAETEDDAPGDDLVLVDALLSRLASG